MFEPFWYLLIFCRSFMIHPYSMFDWYILILMIPEIYGVSKMTTKLCCRPNICYKPKNRLARWPSERKTWSLNQSAILLPETSGDFFYFMSKYGTWSWPGTLPTSPSSILVFIWLVFWIVGTGAGNPLATKKKLEGYGVNHNQPQFGNDQWPWHH